MRGTPLTEAVVEVGVSGGIPFAQRPEGGKLWPTSRQGDVLAAGNGQSISADLRSRGTPLSHVTIRKVLNGSRSSLSGLSAAPGQRRKHRSG
jgi:hypothetical protein